MLDFTSALYLGLRHPSVSLEPWDALTAGRPAALGEPIGAQAVAMDLARLQGCEAASLLPSTLHLFLDLFRVLGNERAAVVMDEGTYPIVRWGAECAKSKGVPLHTFPHHDVTALAHLARRLLQANARPIVVADGYCPACNEPAPIAAYADIAQRSGGYLVIDDTQALGLLGDAATTVNPYGNGGGGSLRWHRTYGPHVVVGASLAKAFGVPVAVLSGSKELIDRFRDRSETRVHCSPPSVAAVQAAKRALQFNWQFGDALRRRLLSFVLRLRHRLLQIGFAPFGHLAFPVQSFRSPHDRSTPVLHKWMLHNGVRTLLTKACQALTANITFLVTARHQFAEIDIAAEIAAQATHVNADHLSGLAGAA